MNNLSKKQAPAVGRKVHFNPLKEYCPVAWRCQASRVVLNRIQMEEIARLEYRVEQHFERCMVELLDAPAKEDAAAAAAQTNDELIDSLLIEAASSSGNRIEYIDRETEHTQILEVIKLSFSAQHGLYVAAVYADATSDETKTVFCTPADFLCEQAEKLLLFAKGTALHFLFGLFLGASLQFSQDRNMYKSFACWFCCYA